MNTRADWVDYAKALGIMLVVYGHVARGLYSAGIAIPESLYRLADSVVYSFHMPLFFFLSGLFFYQSFFKRGATELVFNKIDTLLYPYIIWSILQGTIEALLSGYTNGNAAFSDAFMLWQPRAQFWFLYALFFIFITSCLIFTFISEKKVLPLFLAAAALHLSEPLLPQLQILRFVSNNLVYFTFGMLLTHYGLQQWLSSWRSLLVALLGFIVAQFLFHGPFGGHYTDKGMASLLLALGSVLFIVALSMTLAKRPHRWLMAIGTSSMAIYLMHILAGSGTRIMLSKLLGIDSAFIHVVVGCLVGIVVPLLALSIIKRLAIPWVFSAPISQWLKPRTKNRLRPHCR